MKRVVINLQHQSGGEDVVCTRQVNKQRGTFSRLVITCSKWVTQLVQTQNLACVLLDPSRQQQERKK